MDARERKKLKHKERMENFDPEYARNTEPIILVRRLRRDPLQG